MRVKYNLSLEVVVALYLMYLFETDVFVFNFQFKEYFL